MTKKRATRTRKQIGEFDILLRGGPPGVAISERSGEGGGRMQMLLIEEGTTLGKVMNWHDNQPGDAVRLTLVRPGLLPETVQRH